MIKNFIRSFAAFAAICFVATSCGSEDEPILNDSANSTGTEFTIALNDMGDNQTRAARPLYSSAAYNKVNEVQLKLFVRDENNAWVEATNCSFEQLERPIEDGKLGWAATTTEGVPGTATTGRDKSQTISIKGMAANKTYKIVAYGYNSTITTDVAFTAGAAVFTPKKENAVEEIFAGEKEFTTNEDAHIDSKTKIEVKLLRQVAGFLSYFKNIPTKVKLENGDEKSVAGVRVKAVASAAAYKLGTPAGVINKQNQTETTFGQVTVVDMPINNTTVTDLVSTGATYTFQQKIDGVYVAPNSVLSGKFLVAFAKRDNAPTFVVELYDNTNATLKSWNVTNTVNNAKTTSYSVNRNEFYMIGKKYSTTGGTDPDGPDPDDPIDLHSASELSITIVDAWDVIYNLGLE